jgi:broad specificity phosphatase PhoE
MTHRVYLVRHGENPANLLRQFSHRKIDYPLNPKGILQAEQTADVFHAVPLDGIYSSPLLRAVETATIIAAPHRLPVQIVDEFRELNVGDLEGQPVTSEIWDFHDSILSAWENGNPDPSFPGGEDHHTLKGRMRRGLERILHGQAEQTIVIVGHITLFTFSISDLCPGVCITPLRRQRSRNASIAELELDWVDGHLQGQLVRWADSSHLSGLAAEPVPASPSATPRVNKTD